MVEIDTEQFRKDFSARKEKFQKEKGGVIPTLADSLMDIVTLSKTQMTFYRERHEFCVEKFSMQNKISFLINHRKEYKYEILKGTKGQETEIKKFKDRDLILKNDYERNIVFEHYCSDLDYLIDDIQSYLSYVENMIATIDKMLFGIPYAIEMQKYRSELKT